MKNKGLPGILSRLGNTQNGERKHLQLSNCLRDAIRAGVLKPGERLPTELELVAATPFSLGTVQRAVRSLVDAGLVERTRKLGTFVRKRIDEPWHFRFLDADRRSLLPAYPTVVLRTDVRQRGPWNDFLEGPLVRIDRVVNVNDEFRAYSKFFFQRSRFSALEKAPLASLHGKNFRVLLNREIHEPIKRICHRFFLHRPSAQVAQAIAIDQGTLCAIVEIAAAVSKNAFIYYQELTVPPSERRLALADPMLVGDA